MPVSNSFQTQLGPIPLLELDQDFSDFSSSAVGKGSALVAYIPRITGGVASNVELKLSQYISVFDFMTPAQIADVQARTAVLNVSAPLRTAIAAAIATTGRLYAPAGRYRLDTITLTAIRGLIIEGAGGALDPLGNPLDYPNNTVFSFSNATAGTHGFDISDFSGLYLKNFNIMMDRSGAGGGGGIYLHNGRGYSVDGINAYINTGGGGFGIVFGGGSGATATLVGAISNCMVYSHGGAAYYCNSGTSLTFTNCYQVGGYFTVNGMGYCAFNGCASEYSTGYGYNITGSSACTFTACGAESNAKGAFYLSSLTNNIAFITPYGAGNNTSADATIGSLFHIDGSAGAVSGITITNPVDESPNGATTASIYGNAGNGAVEVSGVVASHLAKGFGGNATWVARNLTVKGEGEIVHWTPVLNTWTNTGTPTVSGHYVKRGSLVEFSVSIIPATNISCTVGVSTITGLPFGAITSGAAMMTDANAKSYGAVILSTATNAIYPQTSGVLTVEIVISGTLIL